MGSGGREPRLLLQAPVGSSGLVVTTTRLPCLPWRGLRQHRVALRCAARQARCGSARAGRGDAFPTNVPRNARSDSQRRQRVNRPGGKQRAPQAWSSSGTRSRILDAVAPAPLRAHDRQECSMLCTLHRCSFSTFVGDHERARVALIGRQPPYAAQGPFLAINYRPWTPRRPTLARFGYSLPGPLRVSQAGADHLPHRPMQRSAERTGETHHAGGRSAPARTSRGPPRT